MKPSVSLFRLIGLGAVLAVVPLSLLAQNDTNTDWNHFGLNFRAGFNIRAKFSEPSTLALPPAPGANHQYTDGFVNLDSSGNAGGLTWNWGYQHASQYSGGDILFHANGGGMTGGSEHATDDPNLGFDFNYVRDLGHETWGQWGIKFAFGYTHVGIRDSDPMSANVENITDAYPLSGVVPPAAPYSGSFAGPGPLLGSQPISHTVSIVPGGAVITGNHNIDAGLYDLRLGPSFNVPLFNRFSVQAGGGLAVGLVDSHFTFSENSIATGPMSGGSRHTECLPGAYAELGFAYRLCHSTSVFTGVQFQYLEDFNQAAAGRSAQLSLGQTIFYELGLQWQF